MPERLCDLAVPVPTIREERRLTSVLTTFTDTPSLNTLVVTNDGAPIGVISRADLFERAATSPPGTLGQLRACDIAELIPSLDGRQRAASLAWHHHRDDFAQLRSGAFIMQDDELLGLLELPVLLRAVARENAARARAMKVMAQRAASAEATGEAPASEQVPAQTKAPADWAADQMLAMLAHEIRTPLTGIIGLADILTKRLRSPDERTMADTISRSGSALDRILRDTLDLAGLRTGELEIKAAPANVADLVVDLRKLWAPQADAKGLSLHVSFRPDGPYRIETDLGKVQQVANNLVSNALKFTNRGGVSVEIATSGEDGDVSLSVRVVDTGPGLTPAQKTSIFKAFARGEALQGEPGWGLGLTISKGLTEHLGGVLTVEDNPSGGAVFTMTIPVAAAESGRVADIGQARRRRTRHGKFELGEILLIEDHRPTAIVLKAEIEEAGWSVHHAESLAAAEQQLERRRYQAILTDLHLLDGSALGLIGELRNRTGPRAHVPIIALTADMSPRSGDVALATGADRIMRKPIRGPELVATIADIVVKKMRSHLEAPDIRGLAAASPLSQASA